MVTPFFQEWHKQNKQQEVRWQNHWWRKDTQPLLNGLPDERERSLQPIKHQNPKLQVIKECLHNLQVPLNEDLDQEWLPSDKSASTKNLPNCCWDIYHSNGWFGKLPVNTERISISSIQCSVLFKRLVRPTWYHYLRMHRFVLFMRKGKLLWRNTLGSWDESEKFNMSLQLNYTYPSFFQRRYIFDDKTLKDGRIERFERLRKHHLLIFMLIENKERFISFAWKLLLWVVL